nr:hypothetical protein [Candidatus Poseidoniales archaeon]
IIAARIGWEEEIEKEDNPCNLLATTVITVDEFHRDLVLGGAQVLESIGEGIVDLWDGIFGE